MTSHPRIAVIGCGNVGTHISRAFRQCGLKCELSSSRDLKRVRCDFDVLILAVSDSAIEKVAETLFKQIKGFDGIVVHTSGSVSMEVLAPYFKNYGVFYPLQTFSRDIPMLHLEEVPIFLEANNEPTFKTLKKLAKEVFLHVYNLDSSVRKKLHLASVFACNFVNAMYTAASEILEAEGLPFDVVKPLIMQTANKVSVVSPALCQTGPAVRGDIEVVKTHISLLEANPELKEIYTKLTQYIIKKSKAPNT